VRSDNLLRLGRELVDIPAADSPIVDRVAVTFVDCPEIDPVGLAGLRDTRVGRCDRD